MGRAPRQLARVPSHNCARSFPTAVWRPSQGASVGLLGSCARSVPTAARRAQRELESIEGAGGSCVESLEEAVWSASVPLSGELPGICAESFQAAVWRACRESPGGLAHALPAAFHPAPLTVLPASDLPARAERAPMLGNCVVRNYETTCEPFAMKSFLTIPNDRGLFCRNNR